jgi:hypothetical protein
MQYVPQGLRRVCKSIKTYIFYGSITLIGRPIVKHT